jgi:hypothetical protein
VGVLAFIFDTNIFEMYVVDFVEGGMEEGVGLSPKKC